MARQAEFPRFTKSHKIAQNRKTAKPHRCALVCAKREACVIVYSIFLSSMNIFIYNKQLVIAYYGDEKIGMHHKLTRYQLIHRAEN